MNTSISFSSLLGIVFVVLKLTKTVSWSWLWVLAPFWLPLLATALVLLTYVLATTRRVK